MTAGNKRNRHSGLRCFLQNSQLLVHRIPTAALDPGKHFDSISITRHSRMTRLTPSSYLCGYVRFKWGLLQLAIPATAVRNVAVSRETPRSVKIGT